MLGVDHDKIILLSTPFPTIPMLGKNCCYNVIVFFVGNKRCCKSKNNVLRGARWSMAHDSALFKMTNFLILDRYSFRGRPVSQRRKNASVARVVERVVSHLLQCDEQGTFIDLGA